VVYLRADTEVLMQRIASRDRPYERQMEKDYIHKLNQAYETFFADSPSNMKVLTIDTNDLNFVSRSEALKWVENRIRQALLLPPFQESFPL
jgi:deoxyadenosine/deoxycytidine kinase